MKKIILMIVAVMALTASAFAHSGNTDALGCHMDHKTGVPHCHGGK